MASSAEANERQPAVSAARRFRPAAIEGWNRRLHYYLGLFFLLYIWLFSLTGLLLNHPRWAQHAGDRRTQSKYEKDVEIAQGATTEQQARRIMRQLGIQGELDWPASTPPGRLDFNVSRPGDASQVRVDLATGRAAVQHFENTSFAAFRILHTFNGSRYNAQLMRREWAWTTVWAVLMDAFAAGLVVMVFGSYYMWYRLKRAHRLGWAVLGAGLACCAVFVAALR